MVERVLPEHLRLFIALAVPQAIKDQIGTAQDELRTHLSGALLKWIRPEQFHLTLRFLGNVDACEVEQLTDSVRSVCQSVGPLDLHAKGIGFFPNPRSPRVVWVGVQDRNDQLQSLQSAVQQATLGFSGEKSESHFSGHITLARIKDISRQETIVLARAAERFSQHSFGEWTVHELLILRSDLSSQGAQHSALAAIQFF